jgi:tape measure domain-containing protein
MAKGDILVNIKSEADISGLQDLLNEVTSLSSEMKKQLNAALGGEVVKKFVIETRTDTSGVKQLVLAEKEVLTVLDQVISKKNQLEKIERGSVTSLRQQVNEAKQARDQIAKYRTEVGLLGRDVNVVNDRWLEQNAKVQGLQRSLDLAGASGFWDQAKANLNVKGLSSFASGLTAITNGLQSASIVVGQVIGSFNNLFNALSKIQQFELTFKAIGATQGETQQAFEESSRIALGLGVNLNTVRDGFQQLSPTVLAAGGSMNDVSAITEALSSRFVAFGLGADKSRRVMNGVIQAFSKGKLMAEELTQQISEADPAFRTDLATAIGISVKELGEWVKEGKITSEVMLEILPKLSKADLLFGRLGTTAVSAASALKQGNATIEQVQNQLQNLNQVNLNAISEIFKPFLGSILEVSGAIVDLGTVIAQSQSFKTLAEFINNLSSQFSFVAKSAGNLIGVIIRIADVIALVINSFDNLINSFAGFRPLVGALALLITSKLVVALLALTANGVIGLVSAGLGLATVASTAFASKGIGGLTASLAQSLIGFAGFKKATLDQIAANFAAIGSLNARAAAQAKLKAIEALPTAGGGSIPALAEAAARRAAAKAALDQSAANAAVAASSKAAAAASSTSATAAAASGVAMTGAGVAAGGAATKVGLFAKAGAFLTNPWTIAVAVLALAAIAIFNVGEKAKQSVNGIEAFKTAVDGINKRTADTVKALENAGDSSVDFDEKLASLGTNEWAQKTSGEVLRLDQLFKKAAEEAGQIGKEATKAFDSAAKSIKNYNADLDKSGIQGEKIAAEIAGSEEVIQIALDTTRQKRDLLLQEAAAGGKAISSSSRRQLVEYQKNIVALEKQAAAFGRLKKEAAEKKIPVDVSTDSGVAAIESLKARIQGLQGSVILEADPQKFAKLRGEIDAVEARLQYLQSNRTQIQADITFNVNKQALQSAADLSEATTANIRAQLGLLSAVNDVYAARITFQEREQSDALGALRDRLDGEKEVRDERIAALEEAGASEGEIKRLKAEGRKADKIGANQIKAIENEIKRIQEEKRRQEIEGLRSRLSGLAAINESEQKSLKLAQELKRLEQERALIAKQAAIDKGRDEAIKLSKEIAEAEKRGDTKRTEQLTEQYNIQVEYLKGLVKEADSLKKTIAIQKEINDIESDTLTKQQESTRLGLEAQLAALGVADSLGKAAVSGQALNTATSGIGRVMSEITTGAVGAKASYDEAAAAASGFEEQAQNAGAAANSPVEGPKNLVDGYQKARDAAYGAETAIDDVVDSAGKLEGSTGDAEEELKRGGDRAGEIKTELSGAADEAGNVADAIQGLDGLSVRVNIVGVPGLWSGGPTQAGQTYQVNELGQEGFLSAAGRLSSINKPKNALWRAPSSGTVIPAHIWSGLDVPSGGVSVSKPRDAMRNSGNRGGMAGMVRAIQASLMANRGTDSALQEIATVQAHQTLELGKLSRAIDRFADKDWNVNVGLKSNNSTYLDMLNRKL